MKVLFTVTFCFLVQLLSAQTDKQLVIQGNQSYKKQDYVNAAKRYQQAAEKNDKNAEAKYNLGNALYKSKKTEEAQKAFEAAASIAGDKNMKARSSYNKGVALTRDNKLKESIEAYKQSLRQNPTDEEARENLQKAINELKKQENPSPKPDKQKDQKDKNKDNEDKDKDQPQNKSNLNKKEAEKMLNAVRQEEKKLQQNQQKPKGRAGGSPDKDW